MHALGLSMSYDATETPMKELIAEREQAEMVLFKNSRLWIVL